MRRALLFAILVGVVLRVVAVSQHDFPRGDVQLDVGVARSLAQGEGFRSGFERGTAFARGSAPPPPQDLADQHPPLWPLLGAAASAVTGSPFSGLKLVSLLCGLLALVLTWRVADRLVEGLVGAPDGLPALATALVALCFVMVDASGNGSLYMAQACAVLLLVELLAAPAPSALRIGLLLGAAWLLNHQALVLLPVPAAVLALAAPRGARLRSLGTGLLAALVAAAVQLPWWWRNAQVFGAPLYTVNDLYPLVAAGLRPELLLENGLPVARFAPASLTAALLRGQPGWLPGNVLYLLGTGLMLWPGLLALAASAALPLGARALRSGDRRLLALLGCLVLLAGIALAWPGMKLRYLVPITPLVVLLGVRVLAAPPQRAERVFAWLVVGIWAALLLFTLGDLTGSEAQPRPERWQSMALAGVIFLVLPLLLRHWRPQSARVGAGLRLGLCSGILAVPLLAALALLPWPHTAYHSTVLTPDVYGQAKERLEARAANTAMLAEMCLREPAVVPRRSAGAGGADARAVAPVVIGPVELLALPDLQRLTLPLGAGLPFGDDALAALIDAHGADAVLVFSGEGWPEGLAVGDRWLAGRLRVVAAWSAEGDSPRLAAGMLSVVQR